MANEKHIPEDIILNILSRLPVKSLIRFSAVSKRWRFLILSDPQFARSHMEVASAQKTLCRRLLVVPHPQVESPDLKTPWTYGDNSSVRKLTFPFNQAGGNVRLLGSCNGLVCVEVVVYDCEAWDDPSITYYIWNPSTGLFQKLPDLVGTGSERYHGFGYLSATNEYKLIIKTYKQLNIFSTRSHVWEKIQSPFQREPLESRGILLNEALHWIPDYDFDNSFDNFEQIIYAFDLAKEELLKKPLPTDFLVRCGENWDYSFDGCYLVSFEGCLCVCRYDYPSDCIVLWVLREYDVCDSWTKLFNLRISDQRAKFSLVLIRGSSTVVVKSTDQEPGLMVIDDEEDKICGPYMLEYRPIDSYCVVEYEESLLWLEDYYDRGT